MKTKIALSIACVVFLALFIAIRETAVRQGVEITKLQARLNAANKLNESLTREIDSMLTPIVNDPAEHFARSTGPEQSFSSAYIAASLAAPLSSSYEPSLYQKYKSEMDAIENESRLQQMKWDQQRELDEIRQKQEDANQQMQHELDKLKRERYFRDY